MKNGIYKDYLNAILKGKRVIAAYADSDKKVVGFTPDEKICYFVRAELFPFIVKDETKLFADLYREGMETKEKSIEETGEMKKITVDKKAVTIVQIGNKWVDEKLLKYCDEWEEFTTEEDYHKPIYIWDGSYLTGLVMPMRIKDDE